MAGRLEASLDKWYRMIALGSCLYCYVRILIADDLYLENDQGLYLCLILELVLHEYLDQWGKNLTFKKLLVLNSFFDFSSTVSADRCFSWEKLYQKCQIWQKWYATFMKVEVSQIYLNKSLGCKSFLNFWHFSPKRKETGSSGATESEVWIGTSNVKARKTTKHKPHKNWRSLQFIKILGKPAYSWYLQKQGVEVRTQIYKIKSSVSSVSVSC